MLCFVFGVTYIVQFDIRNGVSACPDKNPVFFIYIKKENQKSVCECARELP